MEMHGVVFWLMGVRASGFRLKEELRGEGFHLCHLCEDP